MHVVQASGPASRPAQNALEGFSADELFELAHWNRQRSNAYKHAAEQAQADDDSELFEQAQALAAWRELRSRVLMRQARRVARAEAVIDELLGPE